MHEPRLCSKEPLVWPAISEPIHTNDSGCWLLCFAYIIPVRPPIIKREGGTIDFLLFEADQTGGYL